jgi:hypothetical protein
MINKKNRKPKGSLDIYFVCHALKSGGEVLINLKGFLTILLLIINDLIKVAFYLFIYFIEN